MRFLKTYSNPPRFTIDGAEVTEAEFEATSPKRLKGLLESATTARSHTTTCWPMKSLALSCHPRQVKAMNERNKKHGVTGVHYERDGTCVLADRGARRQLMRLEGVFDRAGGYGDDHAGESPLYREDNEPFADVELRERSSYFDGRKT